MIDLALALDIVWEVQHFRLIQAMPQASHRGFVYLYVQTVLSVATALLATDFPGFSFIEALTKTFARQLAQYGINVNAVAPHAIETEMSTQWSEEKRESIIEAIPLKRLGKPEDVPEAVVFPASNKASSIALIKAPG